MIRAFHVRSERAMFIPRLVPAAIRCLVILVCAAPLGSAAQNTTIRQYQYAPRADGAAYEIVLMEVPISKPGANEVLVAVHATSINGGYDVDMRDRKPGGPADLTGGIPFADGAGEVVALGTGVTRFKVGDRVAGIFMQRWLDGDRTAEGLESSRGGNAGGMLSEMIVSNEQSLVRIPEHLTYEEAATLPTAGVTAWVGLFKYGGLKARDHVLLEGTGGVSTFGLIFAAAAGAKPIITSSSDAKLERARQLGAFGTVNYRTHPDWQKEVRTLTGGTGVKQVLEVGGASTFAKALEALAFDGHVAMIGTLSGFAPQIPTGPLFGAGAHLTAIYVGARADFEAMNAFITEHELHPVIDRVFEFEQAAAAFDLMADGDYMGKIVVRVR
jgi:NADPH:quinone reductase-like Zn-dependent oxidoreductase